MQFLLDRKTYNKRIANFVLLIIFAVQFLACDSTTDVVTQSNNVYWKTSSTVGATQGSSAIIIEGVEGLNWSAEIIGGSDWCSFSSLDPTNTFKTGSVASDLNILYVYYTANATTDQRRAKISFRLEGEDERILDLVQLVQSQKNFPAFNSWAEIPSYKENPNYQYVTHSATLNNRSVRNFSLCFDKTKKVALWVAYPMHTAYLGSGGRTDAWAFDPLMKSEDQANCVFYSYKGQYDRGHQIASADRLANIEMNAQTFYMSNITPQLDRLNQDMWANLETKVRSYKCSDTLYVVTGVHFAKDALSNITDGGGNTVPIPTNYFKVLLRTKSGTTGKKIVDCQDSELISIGFWVEHKSYGNITPPRSVCTSVAQIEEKTGFTLFPQASAVVKQQNNPAQWGL